MPGNTVRPLDFEAIFSATASAYLMLDTRLIIVGVNDTYLRATQRSREDLMGRHVFDAFPPNPSDPLDSGVPRLQQSFERVLETKAADHVGVFRFDIPTGHELNNSFETRYWNPINSPVFSRDGELTHIIHQAIDVTEQVKSENARCESERRYKALTGASGVIYRMTADWSHMYELDGRGFLKDTSTFAEYCIEDYVPREDQALVYKTINEAIRNKDIFELEHRVRRVDGSLGWTYSKAVPILDTDGEIVEWIGSAADVTSRKVAEEALKNANRRKDEFLAMLSHELRNPLAPILMASALLKKVQSNERIIENAIDVIARQVNHMVGLVDDLLDVSRVTSGLIEVQLSAIDIREALDEAVEQVMSQIQIRRHQLDIASPSCPAIVRADKKRIVQIVTNLLSNAAKYTPEGGHLRLEVALHDGTVAIRIEDDGLGMSPEFIPHAFELFAQAERTPDRAAGGLGLGLALVKNLVELHGGEVACSSGGLGRGSQFTVTLPRYQGGSEIDKRRGTILSDRQ